MYNVATTFRFQMAYTANGQTSVGDAASGCLRRGTVWFVVVFGDSYMVVQFNIFESARFP